MDRRSLSGKQRDTALSYWRGWVGLLLAQAAVFTYWFVPWALVLDIALLFVSIAIYLNVRDRGDETLGSAMRRLLGLG